VVCQQGLPLEFNDFLTNLPQFLSRREWIKKREGWRLLAGYSPVGVGAGLKRPFTRDSPLGYDDIAGSDIWTTNKLWNTF
jgi:hypothetical protein